MSSSWSSGRKKYSLFHHKHVVYQGRLRGHPSTNELRRRAARAKREAARFSWEGPINLHDLGTRRMQGTFFSGEFCATLSELMPGGLAYPHLTYLWFAPRKEIESSIRVYQVLARQLVFNYLTESFHDRHIVDVYRWTKWLSHASSPSI